MFGGRSSIALWERDLAKDDIGGRNRCLANWRKRRRWQVWEEHGEEYLEREKLEAVDDCRFASSLPAHLQSLLSTQAKPFGVIC